MTSHDINDKIKDALEYIFSWEWSNDYEIDIEDLSRCLNIASFSKDTSSEIELDDVLLCLRYLGYDIECYKIL